MLFNFLNLYTYVIINLGGSMNIIKVSKEAFKKIKKYKKIYYVVSNDLELNPKEKVIVQYENKKIKRTIKNIYNESDKLNSKYIYNNDNKGTKIVEFKRKKKIIRKTLLGLFILLILSIVIYFSMSTINDLKIKRIQNKLDNIKDNKPTYVVVKINPEVMLEYVDGKVKSSSCLNEDCKKIYNLKKLKGLDINKTIEYLYEKAKESGINVDGGVKVYSDEEIKIDKEYAKYEKITTEDLNKYMNKSNIDNSYEEDLLKIYKSDSDYNKLYYCTDNGKVACYLTDEFYEELSKFAVCENGGCPGTEYFQKFVDYITYQTPKLDRVLRKFNVKTYYKEELGYKFLYGMYLGDTPYSFGLTASWGISAPHDEDGNPIGEDIELTHSGHYISLATDDQIDDMVIILKTNKINLVDSTYNPNDLIIWDRKNMKY